MSKNSHAANRRWNRRKIGCATIVALALIAVYAMSPGFVTTAEIDALRPGMSKEEVRSLLGAPGFGFVQRFPDGSEVWTYPLSLTNWYMIGFDSSGHVSQRNL